jgi:tetratricopeptide (TPR) repeat protein
LQSPWLLLFRIVLLILAILLPTLCLLITLYSSSIKGLFNGQSWGWLLNQRRTDLVTFWSSLIGGSLVMFLCALLPALILAYMGFKDSSKTGLNISGFLYLWIVSTIPLLNGRLAGAFVAQDFVQIDFIADETLTMVKETDPPAPVITTRPLELKPDLAEIEQRIAELEESGLAEAMTAASELEMSLVAPIRGQIEQMLLHIRHGDSDSARNSAEKAIDSAAQRGFADISMKLFEKLGADRRKLKLAAYSLEILGNMYQQKKQLLDAAWCLHAAANVAGDAIKAQKRLFQIAEIAEKSGKQKEAHTLYEILIKQYPDSTLVEFAQQGVARTKIQNI